MNPTEYRQCAQVPEDPTQGARTGVSEQVADTIRRHRAGDPTAMTDLVRIVTPWLRKLVRGIGLSAHSTDDVVQTALLAMVSRGDQIRSPEAGVSWLAVTARREAIRVAQSERAVELVAEIGLGEADANSPGPETIVLERLRRALLWRHVAELPVRGQAILHEIAHVGRPDYAALSGLTGMPIGSIGPTRGRSLRRVRDLLQKDEDWAAFTR
jgi:DNA-directed RNA polymerase specialized sigma24 family protein